MKSNSKYTLKDIAELAEVSRATVDRVIHGKGKVSKETYKKVKLILDKIDYQPNLIAQTLRKGELKKIAVLMPDNEYDIYWDKALQGINKAINDFSFMGIKVNMHLFNPFKEVSFKLHSKQILKGGYDGVIVAPVFYKEAKVFFNQCVENNLPFVTFNTHIEEDNKLCHVGQDLIQSGEIAASLLYKVLSLQQEYLIVHIDEDISNAKHIEEKEIGFRNFLKQKGIREDQINVLKINNTSLIEKELLGQIEANSSIKGIFVTTSKVHYVADVVEAYSKDLVLIGYDLIEENIQQLNNENIDFLIFQNPGFQANQAITLFVDYLVLKKEISKEVLLPIEIIIKENFKYHL